MGRTGFNRAERWSAVFAVVLALLLAPLALLGLPAAAVALLVMAGTVTLTVLADATARLTGSRAAVAVLCIAAAGVALAALVTFSSYEVVGGELRYPLWVHFARGMAFGGGVAVALALSRLEPRRRSRRSFPPGAPY